MSTARDVTLIGVIVFIVAIAFFVTWYIADVVIDSMVGMAQINESSSAVEALQSTQSMTNRFDYILFAVFIGLALSLVIVGFFVGGNVLFSFIYLLVVVVAVVFSTVLSYVWEEVSTLTLFGTTVSAFPITNHILNNLPVYVSIIGILGFVAMFAKPAFTHEEGMR